jgi:hypothetical protein
MVCSINAVTTVIVFSNSCYLIAATLLYSDASRHRLSAAADNKKNGEQWHTDVLLSHDLVMSANRQQLNMSRDRQVANDQRQRITSTSSAECSERSRRRSRRKILRFDFVPHKKWRFPIKYKVDDGISGKAAV